MEEDVLLFLESGGTTLGHNYFSDTFFKI